MKKILNIIITVITVPIVFVSNAQANENNVAFGGFAVVHPETGVVHGVIVGSIKEFGGNNQTMPNEFMGCPVGCLIIQQSTSDQNGNVAGIHGPDVTYNQDKNVFQSVQTNTVQTETIISPILNETVTSSVLNTYVVETSVSVNRPKIYEFGVQDLTNTNGQFQINEVAPTQNTGAQISGYTKKFVCEDASETCSKDVSNTSSTLSEEVISFSERKTALEVSSIVAAQNLSLLQSRIERLLILLGLWVL